jgi:acyl-CoA thioester hydrolase
VHRCSIDFIRPARLDDLIEVETAIADVGAATLDVRHRFLRDGEELAHMEVRLACMNAAGRATRIPAIIRDALAERLRRARHATQ